MKSQAELKEELNESQHRLAELKQKEESLEKSIKRARSNVRGLYHLILIAFFFGALWGMFK